MLQVTKHYKIKL